jgi:hypothetical protein
MLALAGIAAIFCRCRDDPAVASPAMTFPGTDSKPAGLLFSPASAERRHHCNDHDFHRLAAKPARHRSRAAVTPLSPPLPRHPHPLSQSSPR